MPAGPIPPRPRSTYTPWVIRVLASLIDFVACVIIQGIGGVILIGSQDCISRADTEYGALPGGADDSGQLCGPSTLGQSSVVVFGVLALAFFVWNYGYRQGTTGSSVGKRLMRFEVVDEVTLQPVGLGMSLCRQIAHVVDAIVCYLGFLFPLWDAKRQTFADKLTKTVCIPR